MDRTLWRTDIVQKAVILWTLTSIYHYYMEIFQGGRTRVTTLLPNHTHTHKNKHFFNKNLFWGKWLEMTIIAPFCNLNVIAKTKLSACPKRSTERSFGLSFQRDLPLPPPRHRTVCARKLKPIVHVCWFLLITKLHVVRSQNNTTN